MKCPYRTHTHITHITKNSECLETGRYVEFEECYKENCPFYDKDKWTDKEYCDKAESEKK